MFSALEASIPVACAVPRHPAPVKVNLGNDANKPSVPSEDQG